MNTAEMNVSLLCPLLQEILAEATSVAEGLADGWSLTVSTYPDVSLNAPDGHWAGIIREHDCAAPDPVAWTVWRGSLGGKRKKRFETLEEAVDWVAGVHRSLKADA